MPFPRVCGACVCVFFILGVSLYQTRNIRLVSVKLLPRERRKIDFFVYRIVLLGCYTRRHV